MNIAARQYSELARSPRGTWITYTNEMAETRSRLDAAIIAVESEDVGQNAANNARDEAKNTLIRAEQALSDIKAKAKEGSGISDEQRHAATARSLAEYAAENSIPATTPAEQMAIAAELCREAGRLNCGPPGSEKADAEIVANWRARNGLGRAPTPALTRK